jgi:hypothetical protein
MLILSTPQSSLQSVCCDCADQYVRVNIAAVALQDGSVGCSHAQAAEECCVCGRVFSCVCGGLPQASAAQVTKQGFGVLGLLQGYLQVVCDQAQHKNRCMVALCVAAASDASFSAAIFQPGCASARRELASYTGGIVSTCDVELYAPNTMVSGPLNIQCISYSKGFRYLPMLAVLRCDQSLGHGLPA